MAAGGYFVRALVVDAKSPLTGMLNDALSSSHFAISGKLTGHDAIVVHGACEERSALLVNGAGARFTDATAFRPVPGGGHRARRLQHEGDGPTHQVTSGSLTSFRDA